AQRRHLLQGEVGLGDDPDHDPSGVAQDRNRRDPVLVEQALEVGLIGMEAENQHPAIEAEAFEAEVMYRDFQVQVQVQVQVQAQAQAVGDHATAERFQRLREDERRNRDRFLAVLRARRGATRSWAVSYSAGSAGSRAPGHPVLPAGWLTQARRAGPGSAGPLTRPAGANGLPARRPAALGTSPLVGYGARATTKEAP
ncbi:MAG TPA: hypothetical protein VFS70_22945, partial [Actinomycetota bacterium]|nr:hypothetical protein [Actinomycetota bacterium]